MYPTLVGQTSDGLESYQFLMFRERIWEWAGIKWGFSRSINCFHQSLAEGLSESKVVSTSSHLIVLGGLCNLKLSKGKAPLKLTQRQTAESNRFSFFFSPPLKHDILFCYWMLFAAKAGLTFPSKRSYKTATSRPWKMASLRLRDDMVLLR